jgi:signal transduction histidine kinase
MLRNDWHISRLAHTAMVVVFPRILTYLMIIAWAPLLETLTSAPAHAGSDPPGVIELSGEDIVFRRGVTFEWAEGTSTDEDPAIIAPEKWTTSSQSPNVGPGATAIWYRVRLHNPTPFEMTPSFVSMDAAIPESANLIVEQEDGTRKISRSGTTVPMNNRPIVSRLIVLPMTLAPGETITAYLGIQSYYTRNLLYQIKMPASLARYEANSMLFFGLFFGLLWYFIFINILAWRKLRMALSLVYAIFCLSVFIPCFVGIGFLNLLIPGHWVLRSGLLENCLIPLQISAACLLTREYLNTRDWAPVMWKFFTAFTFIGFIIAVITSFNLWTALMLQINNAVVTICTLSALATAAIGVRRKRAAYGASYMIGFGSYMVLGVIWINQIEGRIPSVWWSTHGVFVGQIIQTGVVSYVILNRLREFSENKVRLLETEKNAERMSTFVKVLTHDLSNYLTVITFNAQMLKDSGRNTPDWQEKLNKIIRAGNNQKDVMESIRTLKAAEDGKVDFTLEPVDMATVLDSVKDTQELAANQKGVILRFPDLSKGQCMVFAERHSLTHSVLNNLMTNAIKFSLPGKTVEIDLKATDDKVAITVIDSGIGIPATLIDKLFDAEAKTSRKGTSGENGTGFGLPIVKAYVDRYRGSISVTSRPVDLDPIKHGTTFTVELMRA